MRTVIAVGFAVVALSVVSCSKKEDPAAGITATSSSASPPSSAAVAASAAPRAEIGGQVVTVGEHQVELRLFANGSADALIRDSHGALLDDKAKAKLLVHANAKADAHPTIELAFEPALGRFAADASAKAELTPGPVDIELRLGDATTKGRLEAAVLLVGPQIGGTLLVAGKFGVELDARADGHVEALVRDSAGALVNGDAGLKLEVKLPGADGQAHAIALAWDGAKARFAGQVDAAVKLAAGPIDVSVNGEIAAHLPAFALRAEAKHGGRVFVAGDFSVELVAKGDAVSAFVVDASGKAVAKADLELSLRAGAGAFVKLVWDAPSLSYRAKLGAKLDLDATPITLGLRADGKAFVAASIPSVAVDAKAKLDTKANAKVKLDTKANAGAKASAAVKAPKVEVSKSASASAGGGGASAKAGFSFGTR